MSQVRMGTVSQVMRQASELIVPSRALYPPVGYVCGCPCECERNREFDPPGFQQSKTEREWAVLTRGCHDTPRVAAAILVSLGCFKLGSAQYHH